MSNFLTYRNLLVFILSAAFLALFVAYSAQYFFGFLPCKFCYFGRCIYFALVIVSFCGLYLNHEFKRWIIRLLSVALAIGIIINVFHVAIEHNWIVPNSMCISNLSSYENFKDFKIAFEDKDLVSCDQPTAFFLGLTLVTWNLLYLLILSYTFICYAKRGNHAT